MSTFHEEPAARVDWETPYDVCETVEAFGHALGVPGGVTLDPCGSPRSPLLAEHYCMGPQWGGEDGLAVHWASKGDPGSPRLVYVNPPYGRGIAAWLGKCAGYAQHNMHAVGLVPNRTDTAWFHDWVFGTAQALVFVCGRFKFGDGSGNGAKFGNVIAHWGPYSDLFADHFGKYGKVLFV